MTCLSMAGCSVDPDPRCNDEDLAYLEDRPPKIVETVYRAWSRGNLA
jgi:hypothetical protein